MNNKKSILKTLSIISILTLLLSAPVKAQRPGAPDKPRINHQQIVSQLNLDESTKNALLDVMNTHRSAHKEQRTSNRKQHQEMRENNRKEIKILLTEEQFLEFEKIMRRNHKNRP